MTSPNSNAPEGEAQGESFLPLVEMDGSATNSFYDTYMAGVKRRTKGKPDPVPPPTWTPRVTGKRGEEGPRYPYQRDFHQWLFKGKRTVCSSGHRPATLFGVRLAVIESVFWLRDNPGGKLVCSPKHAAEVQRFAESLMSMVTPPKRSRLERLWRWIRDGVRRAFGRVACWRRGHLWDCSVVNNCLKTKCRRCGTNGYVNFTGFTKGD